MRPYIVFFGEMVPMLERAIDIVAQADVVLVIGTSLQVYPANGLVNEAPSKAPNLLDRSKSQYRILFVSTSSQ